MRDGERLSKQLVQQEVANAQNVRRKLALQTVELEAALFSFRQQLEEEHPEPPLVHKVGSRWQQLWKK